MSFEQGISEIKQDFRRLENKFADESWQFGKKISDAWVYEIQVSDAIDEGHYLRAVNWHEADGTQDQQQYVVDTSDDQFVTYSGFVEGGTKRMAARYPAKKGIERTDFGGMFDSFVDFSFPNSE